MDQAGILLDACSNIKDIRCKAVSMVTEKPTLSQQLDNCKYAWVCRFQLQALAQQRQALHSPLQAVKEMTGLLS